MIDDVLERFAFFTDLKMVGLQELWIVMSVSVNVKVICAF